MISVRMISVELLNFSSGNPVSAKFDLKSKSNFSSIGYDRIMEKALMQRENKEMPQNTDKYKDELDFKTIGKEIVGNQQMCKKENNESQTCKDVVPLENITNEDITKEDIAKEQENIIDSILAMLSGVLNLSQQDLDKIRDILSNPLKSNIENEPLEASIIKEIHTILQGIELPNKEDIDNAIKLLATLKQKPIIAEVTIDELDLTDDDLKDVSLLKDNKGARELSLFDSPMQRSIDGVNEKLEIVKSMVIDNAIENVEISDKTENNEQSDSDDNEDNKNSMGRQVKNVDIIETPDTKNKTIEAIGAEYIATDEKNSTINDSPKITPKNLGYQDRAQSINKEELFSQIIENSKVNENQDISEIRIQLKPDSLGKLTISLIMEKGQMTAKFIAENHRVKEAIESNFSELKDSLSQKGINIQNLSVSVGQQGKWQYENQNFKAWKNNIKRSSYIGDVDLELEEETSAYRNPYNLNQGSVDIKV